MYCVFTCVQRSNNSRDQHEENAANQKGDGQNQGDLYRPLYVGWLPTQKKKSSHTRTGYQPQCEAQVVYKWKNVREKEQCQSQEALWYNCYLLIIELLIYFRPFLIMIQLVKTYYSNLLNAFFINQFLSFIVFCH